MSAICGILHLDLQAVARADIEQMREALAHRGLDGGGLWCEGQIGLGHLLVWTTPESLDERQPLINDSKDLIITADVRLDNRQDLMRRLDLKNCSSSNLTDSALVLQAYEKWSERCVEHLIGDFAFAIWDARRKQLFCARDHFGVKPFYYHHAPLGLFAFASEIKGLFSDQRVPRRLDEVKVAAHLTGFSDGNVRTFYRDVKRLPPAHTLTVTRESLDLRAYWSLDPERELRLNSDHEYAEAFLEIFREAVRCRLRSHFPIGSMLSGGLDSSSVTCMARKLLAQTGGARLHTFSAVFDDVSESDEQPFQLAVLNQNDVVPHRFHADQVSPLIDLERVLWHQDEAFFAGNLYLHWCQYEIARTQGIRVMLEGFDGDTTVSHGLGYLSELAQSGRWLTLAREVKGYSNKIAEPWFGAYRAWVWKYGLNPLISKSLLLRQGRRIGRAVNRKIFARHQPGNGNIPTGVPFNRDFARRLSLPERFSSEFGSSRTERENHHNLLSNAILPDSLEKLDRTAAAFGLEIRYPFFDRRLAEFCLSLPPEQKMSRGWTRMVMRRAMEGILPTEIQWRGGKADLGPSFDHGLRTFERCRIEKLVLQKSDLIEKYIDISALRKAYHRFVDGRATENEGLLMWRAVSLALWLESNDHLQSTT